MATEENIDRICRDCEQRIYGWLRGEGRRGTGVGVGCRCRAVCFTSHLEPYVLMSHILASYELNFITEIPARLLEKLAAKALESDCSELITKVHDAVRKQLDHVAVVAIRSRSRCSN
jgi:hypothetical protein